VFFSRNGNTFIIAHKTKAVYRAFGRVDGDEIFRFPAWLQCFNDSLTAGGFHAFSPDMHT